MRIGRIFDIDIHISKTLILLIAVLLITGQCGNFTAVFFMFLIHEAAHVAAARLLKLKVQEIELLPFGGAVKIHSYFESHPVHEIVVAASGPLANILLLLLYLGGIQMKWLPAGMPDPDIVNINLMLAGFNLLPALPLDGGRILRAVLARQMNIERATKIASGMGFLLSLALFTIGLYGLYYRVFNYSLFVFSGFLFYSALRERRNATYAMLMDITCKKEALLREGSMPIRNIAVLYSLPLKEVVRRFVPQRYHYIQVLDDQLMERGILNESQIVNGLLDFGAHVPVGRLFGKR